eukprot:TRINITY_DN12606_c0_g1_i1.p1 TRINITY_DN12606_c0_g1~~TRINITY_DN12606_c0_g1_i1.p1  ORF type:complete len:258 (+),score=36.86 TRINITY_DN12606_c0_g1_i1:36-776(+)
MTDDHRLLVQYFLAKAVVSETDLTDAFEKMIGQDKNWEDYLPVINNNLIYVFLEIRRAVSEYDQTAYWALVNARSDEQSILATSFTSAEIEYFKKVITEIIEEQGRISETKAVNQALPKKGEKPPLTLEDAQNAIHKFISEEWLMVLPSEEEEEEEEERSTRRNKKRKNTHRYLGIGIRTTMELKPWIDSEFQDSLKECNMCSESTLMGVSCPNVDCNTWLHKHCYNRLNANGSAKCPKCKTRWKP